MDDTDESLGLFEEPADFYPPEKQPTFVQYETLGGQTLTLRLVGHNPLWGHFLWNAGRIIAAYLETHAATLLADKTVLEFGAGAGLPSLVSALHGARAVVVTDYPDADLIDNLRYNVTACAQLLATPSSSTPNLVADGYLWGADARGLAAHVQALLKSRGKNGHAVVTTDATVGGQASEAAVFDLVILADLLFNHSEHGKLIASLRETLRRSDDAQALVFFTPYRPWLLEKDLAFFDLAREEGFVVEKILETTMDKVMFEEDPGDELLRRTVFGYRLTWTTAALQHTA